MDTVITTNFIFLFRLSQPYACLHLFSSFRGGSILSTCIYNYIFVCVNKLHSCIYNIHIYTCIFYLMLIDASTRPPIIRKLVTSPY